MIARISALLAALLLVGATALPAAAARNAEDLLILEGPAGLALMPEQPGATGPISLADLARSAGIAVPPGLNSSSGFSRAWKQGDAAVIAFALTFDDQGSTLADGIAAAFSGFENAEPLPGIEGAYRATVTGGSGSGEFEMVAFGRGDAFFLVMGTADQRANVIDLAQRQSVLAGPADSSPGVSSATARYGLRAAFLLVLGGVLRFVRSRSRKGGGMRPRLPQPPRLPRRAATGPVPSWSIGPPTS